MRFIKVKINNKSYKTLKGKTILEIVGELGISLPSLCHFPQFSYQGVCRLCVVEVKNKGFLPACSTFIEEEMEIFTHSPLLEEMRRQILRLLYTNGHIGRCRTCARNDNCQLLSLVIQYKAYPFASFFSVNPETQPVQKGKVIFDPSKCIKCRLCIEACKKYGSGVLKLRGFSQDLAVIPPYPKEKCIECLQCARICPVGAIVIKED